MRAAIDHPAVRARFRPTGLPAIAVYTIVLLVSVLLIALAAPAAAPAYQAYQHGGIDDCETCHDMAHTDRTPTSDVCFTCHFGYQIVRAGETCWTCHTPGRDMSWARTDASCLTTCHLRGGLESAHVAHVGGSAACTSCHALTTTAAISGGSAHHTIPAPRLDLVTPSTAAPGATVTLTGAAFTWAVVVRFGGVAAAFTVVSDTSITAAVPEDAVTGNVTVLSGGGLATSSADFVVLRPQPPQPPVLTLSASRRTVAPGGRVTLSGTLTPFDPLQRVRMVVQRRVAGSWKTTAGVQRPLGTGGAYSWTHRVRLAGTYRARSSAAGVSSVWVRFRAR